MTGKRKTLFVLIGALALAALAGAFALGRPATVVVGFEVMGTDAWLKVVGDPRWGTRRTVELAARPLHEVERAMSFLAPDSDVGRLNAHGGSRPVELSAPTLEVMREAVRFARLTGGAFDVTYAPLRTLWKEAETRGSVPAQEAIDAALRAVGSDGLIFEGQAVRFGVEGMKVDLGGIAKGYGIDLAAEELIRQGVRGAVVEVGGDLRLVGRPEDGEKWKVLVQDPRPRGSADGSASSSQAPAPPAIYLRLADVAVATSGDYARFFRIGERTYSHIIDPRTGRPVASVPSVTVVAPDAMTADVLATAVSVLGAAEGIELVDSLDDVECMVMVGDGDQERGVFYSAGFPALMETGDVDSPQPAAR